MSRRAIVIVLDGCGAGFAPDYALYSDPDRPATLLHVWEAVGGIDAPHLAACGFLAAGGVPIPARGRFGRLRPLSPGCDSVTGHWEMMGIVLERSFPIYPQGFPAELVEEFCRRIGRPVLGNVPTSGTEIIARLGAEHVRTGFPILYTSADSVWQIAAHEEVVPVEELYAMCRVARELLVFPHDVQRVIARPFLGNPEEGFVRTARRRDFPLPPPPNLVDRVGDVDGIGVVPELFAGRGFRPRPRTQTNAEHEEAVREALSGDARFVFANFEDFDMLYGHRNDPFGFARALERFDLFLGRLLEELGPDDLLLLTADHGNDPTTPSTDHSREYLPVAVVNPGLRPEPLGDREGLAAIGATVAAWLGVEAPETAGAGNLS